jgi:hypothetical protein
MAFVTRYGSFWGILPQTSGKILFVAPSATYSVEGRSTYIAHDSNSGDSPEYALLTLNQAISNCSADSGDVIVLLPGAHSYTATQTISKAGVTITGIPRSAPIHGTRMPATGARAPTSITCSTAVTNVLTITAADVELCYLHIIPVLGAAGIKPSAAADRLYVHDCTFNMSTAADTATTGMDGTWTGTTTTLDDVTIRNCYFWVRDNQGPALRMQGTTLDLTFENNTIKLVGDTAWDDAIEFVSTSLGTTFRDCDFLQRSSGTVMTDAIDLTGATIDGSSTTLRCYFAVGSDALEVANVADSQNAENYLMQAAANVGGTLILST